MQYVGDVKPCGFCLFIQCARYCNCSINRFHIVAKYDELHINVYKARLLPCFQLDLSQCCGLWVWLTVIPVGQQMKTDRFSGLFQHFILIVSEADNI